MLPFRFDDCASFDTCLIQATFLACVSQGTINPSGIGALVWRTASMALSWMKSVQFLPDCLGF